MSAAPILTYKPDGPGLHVDLDRLVASRMLLTAASGGGKSRALRQLLEETHGRVMQLVIDPEGEFSSLRERFPYVLAAPSGADVQASPKTARMLCRKLVENGASAVLDLYDLDLPARREFVKLFLQELIALPRALWRPMLIVIDEAHQFAPERGYGESQATEAVIALATLGRKRGFCAVLATQRISKLHKDAAADLRNKMIGGVGLDVDVKRAGDELGFDKEERQSLKRLQPGEFYIYGPALSLEVQKVRTGSVTTTHPEAGKIAGAPPPAPAAIRAVLENLANLPQQAAAEEQTISELQRQVKQLRADLKAAANGGAALSEAEVKHLRSEEFARGVAEGESKILRQIRNDFAETLEHSEQLQATSAALNSQAGALHRAATGFQAILAGSVAASAPFVARAAPIVADRTPNVAARRSVVPADGLTGPQQRMLDTLMSFEPLGLDAMAKSHVAVFSGQSPKSSGYRNNLSALAARALIERVDSERVRLTAAGRQLTSAALDVSTLEQLHEAWLCYLTGPQRLMLRILIEAYPTGLEKDVLAKQSGQSPLSSGYRNNISALSALGLLRRASGELVAGEILFPKGLR